VLPIPALTAEQALAGALAVQAGETVVVHGAGGVTGGLLVQLAAHYGARVIATAGPDSADRTRALGAASVLDYHDPDWSDQARALAGRGGADAAANAAPGGAGDALRAVRDGGRLVTITGDAPATTRGISVSALIVAPDGPQLGRLTRLLADGAISVTIGERYRLDQAAQALDRAGRGAHGTAIVLDIEDPR
jgi:NADPH:quinone reductase-like Zn-dependent oxidoreductase